MQNVNQSNTGGELVSPPKTDEVLDVDFKPGDLHPLPSVEMVRENTAGRVAIMLIVIFGCSLLFSFGIVAWLIYLFKERPDFLSEMNNVLEIIKVIGTIFSPLLAFILGYYFGLSNRSGGSNSK